MCRIFLVGYMGAGKTTLGLPLAKALGWSFIDLDIYIENRYHKSINALFSEIGEQKFREIERSVLKEVIDIENVVVSTGGGTPCYFDNMKEMNDSGITVFLDASEAILFDRLKKGKNKRPKIKNKSDLEILELIRQEMKERRPIYSTAKCICSANDLESIVAIDQTVMNIRRAIKDV